MNKGTIRQRRKKFAFLASILRVASFRVRDLFVRGYRVSCNILPKDRAGGKFRISYFGLNIMTCSCKRLVFGPWRERRKEMRERKSNGSSEQWVTFGV